MTFEGIFSNQETEKEDVLFVPVKEYNAQGIQGMQYTLK